MLEDRVKALEADNKALWERLEIVDAGDFRWQALMDGQLSALTQAMLGNIQTMGNILDDLEEHFKTHYLDKKKREEYASKRKTYTIK